MLPGLKEKQGSLYQGPPYIEPGYDLAIPMQWRGKDTLPLAVRKTESLHPGEHRITVEESHDPARDALIYTLRLHDLRSRFVVEGVALIGTLQAKTAVRVQIERAAMDLQRKYFALWSSWPIEELGVTWGLCHKCAQATGHQYDDGVWECPHGCP